MTYVNIYIYISVFYLHIYMCTQLMPSAHGIKKKTLFLVKLELETYY